MKKNGTSELSLAIERVGYVEMASTTHTKWKGIRATNEVIEHSKIAWMHILITVFEQALSMKNNRIPLGSGNDCIFPFLVKTVIIIEEKIRLSSKDTEKNTGNGSADCNSELVFSV